MLMHGLGNFFLESNSKIFQTLRNTQPFSQIFNSAVVVQKQPETTCKLMSGTVLQQNFIYESKQQAGFVPSSQVPL